jgi:hypothetical protein
LVSISKYTEIRPLISEIGVNYYEKHNPMTDYFDDKKDETFLF